MLLVVFCSIGLLATLRVHRLLLRDLPVVWRSETADDTDAAEQAALSEEADVELAIAPLQSPSTATTDGDSPSDADSIASPRGELPLRFGVRSPNSPDFELDSPANRNVERASSPDFAITPTNRATLLPPSAASTSSDRWRPQRSSDPHNRDSLPVR